MNSSNKLFFQTNPSMGGYVTRESNFLELVLFPYNDNAEYGLDKNGYWHNIQIGSQNGKQFQERVETEDIKLVHSVLGERLLLSDEKYICSRWQLTWDKKKHDFSDYGGYHPNVEGSGGGLKKHLINKYVNPRIEKYKDSVKNLDYKKMGLNSYDDLLFICLFHADGRMSSQIIEEMEEYV